MSIVFLTLITRLYLILYKKKGMSTFKYLSIFIFVTPMLAVYTVLLSSQVFLV